MNIYYKAIEEMKNNFNNKSLIVVNRNTNSIVYKGIATVRYFDFCIDYMIKRIFVFRLNNGKFITFDFEDVLYVKLSEKDEYGLVYEKFLFLVDNLKKENINNYITFQNLDFTNKEIEDILYEKQS